MAGQAVSVREIFDHALELATPAERSAYLEVACAGRPEVRREVEALLRALDSAGDFLARPAVEEAIPLLADDTKALGRRVETAEDHPTEATDPAATATGPPTAADGGLGFLQPSGKAGTLGRFLHYEVQQVLGRGGFGTFLKAFDEKLPRPVAVKVLSPRLADDATARRRFLREARAASAAGTRRT
jgi:hypothetical protein